MLDLSQNEIKMFGIFHPFAMEKTIEAIETDQKFVHYCGAKAAFSMIENEEVWMRNASWMNDKNEITYGTNLLSEAINSNTGQLLNEILDREFPGFALDFKMLFDGWLNDFQNNTYITCFTEQLQNEERIGRLSMWREYGSAVAFVMNGGPFLRQSDALNAYTSPVAYLNRSKFFEEYKKLIENVSRNIDFLKERGRDEVTTYLFSAYQYAVICTKKPIYYEEREWRVIYQPNLRFSNKLVEETKVISGNPQRIFKIPLRDHPSEGFYGATLPDLLKYLIIGPGGDANNLQREFIRILRGKGIENAENKVLISEESE